MVDKFQIIEHFEFSYPREGAFKSLSEYVRKYYQGEATLVVDSTGQVMTAFTTNTVFVVNTAAILEKSRVQKYNLQWLNESNIKSSFTGNIYYEYGKTKVKFGIFMNTKEALTKIKEVVAKQKYIATRMNEITLKEWLDNAMAVLVVTNKEAYIEYTFRCNDRRYNPAYLKIDESDIDFYIDSWKEVFEFYQKKKKSFKKTHFLEQGYSTGLLVRINMPDEGVKLHAWDVPITTQEELDDIIKDYQKAKRLIPKLRAKIRKMAEQ